MVNIAEIDLPITFSRNLNTIRLEFENKEENYGKVINIKLKSMVLSSISEWTYQHLLQPSSKVNLTGIEDGEYQLEIKSSESLINKYSISSRGRNISFEKIDTDSKEILLDLTPKNINKSLFSKFDLKIAHFSIIIFHYSIKLKTTTCSHHCKRS